jgi:hypothetical protein
MTSHSESSREAKSEAAQLPSAVVRPARESDFESELRLNTEFVRLLSPLDLTSLRRLDRLSAYHRVAEVDGECGGFVLALREHCDYASPNYRWFAERYPRFLYVDRVVVARDLQGRGLASLLYRDLFDFALRSRVWPVTCELDREPLNKASARFHAKLGFREVGTLAHPGKVVSLQAAEAWPTRAEEASACARGVATDPAPHMIYRDDDGAFGAAGKEERMAFFRDSDGNVLARASRVSPERSP